MESPEQTATPRQGDLTAYEEDVFLIRGSGVRITPGALSQNVRGD